MYAALTCQDIRRLIVPESCIRGFLGEEGVPVTSSNQYVTGRRLKCYEKIHILFMKLAQSQELLGIFLQ